MMTYEEWLAANGRDGTDPQDKTDYQDYVESQQNPDPAAEHKKLYGLTDEDINNEVYGKQLKKYYDDKAYLKDKDGERIKLLIKSMEEQKKNLAAHDAEMEKRGIVAPRNNAVGVTPETWDDSRKIERQVAEVQKNPSDLEQLRDDLSDVNLSKKEKQDIAEKQPEYSSVDDLKTAVGDKTGIDPSSSRRAESFEEVAKKDPRYRRATMSIVEAYQNGEFGPVGSKEAKATRNYFMANAIGTFARNLGRDIGNVGAQFTGGTIDNGHDVADWESRKDEILGNEIQAENESIANSPAYRKAVEEFQNLDSNEIANKVAEIQANYSEDQIRNVLISQLQNLGMNDIALKIQQRKMLLSDIFAAMQDKADGMGKIFYGILASSALPGQTPQIGLNAGPVGVTLGGN